LKLNLLVAAAAAVALLLTIPVSTAGQSSGGTTISVDGDTVNIHLELDIVLVGGSVYSQGRMVEVPGDNREAPEIMAAGEKAAAIWNNALAQYDAGCLKLHLDLTVNVIPWSKDRQLTQVTNGGLTYPITEPGHHVAQWLTDSQDGRPTVWDPFAQSTDQSGDITSPYDHDLPSDWNDQLLDPNAFAHELGHLLGLGDDYTHPPDGEHTALPGREGTLMDNAGPIDQELVDRLGDILAKADPSVPKCKVWEGPIHLDASIEGARGSDQGTGDGTVRVVEKNGDLSGTLSVHQSHGCDRYPGKKKWILRVRGTITRRKLVIGSVPGVVVTDADEEPICGFPDGFIGDQGEPGSPVLPIVAKRASDKTASGSGKIVDNERKDSGFSESPVIITRYTVTLERKSP
jgi:hypothetical protein